MNSIDIFPWDDNFDTGLPTVDVQHRKLVELLNLLASHVAFKTDDLELNSIFDALADYAVYHFETEEAIWHECLADDSSELEHKATHQQFVRTVLELKAAQGQKPLIEIAEGALSFLARWLASHILETDRAMAYAVLAIRSGLTLDAAKQRAKEQMSGATRTLIDIILSIYGSLSTNTLQLMREIAERKRNESVLLAAKQQAEAANLAKSRFLATISHEIRTPLNGILGMGQLLSMPHVTDSERQEYANVVINSGSTLLHLLNGVLDLAAMEAGDMALTHAPFAPDALVCEVCEKFHATAELKGVPISVVAEPSTVVACVGDGERLKQMMACLMSNALKFTERGRISVGWRVEASAGKEATLEFSITDTGIGISEKDQVRLFQPFALLDDSDTRKFGGSGLGLSLVRHLAELMGGTVGIESAPGRGSRVWFRVRVKLAEMAA